ncbi:MAG: type II secretion system protein [Rubripirellula sp.]
MFVVNAQSKAIRDRQAFTLVELLVTMVIAGLISSMVAIALTGAQKSARETRGRAFVDRLNMIALQLYEEESSRNFGGYSSIWTGESLNQSQLVWKRDWLRAALPQSKADVDAGSGRTGAPAVFPVRFLTATGAANIPNLANNSPNIDRNLQSNQYRSRVVNTLSILSGTPLNWDAAYAAWSETHESAECLYLIFASRTLSGEPLLSQLRPRDIADTDGDGMPEIVDPWGEPVLWMRTPVGFYLKNDWTKSETTVAEMRSLMNSLGPDPIDILRTDPRNQYTDDDNPTDVIDMTAVNGNREVDKLTFFARPIVVSAGADQEFDMVLKVPGTGRETMADNGVTSATMGQLAQQWNGFALINHPTGYGSTVFFPDPFYTLPIVNPSTDGPRPIIQRPGAVTDVDGDNVDDSADNIYPALAL